MHDIYHDTYYENNPDFEVLEKELTIFVNRLHEELDEEENQSTRDLLEEVEKVLYQVRLINN